MKPKEARDLNGYRQVEVRYLSEASLDPIVLRVLCANTLEWLALQEATSKAEFPGWAGKFEVLAPGWNVISAKLVDIDAKDLDSCIAHYQFERAKE